MGFDERTFKKSDPRQSGGNQSNGEQNGRQHDNHNQGKPNAQKNIFSSINSLEDFLNSPFVLAGFASAILAVIAGYHFLVEDFYTTKLGWDSLPLNMVNESTGWWFALGLTVAPTFFYTLSMVMNKRWLLYVSFACMIFDAILDMSFRMHTPMEVDFRLWLKEFFFAILVSFGLFTIMSEISFSFGLPLVIYLFPHAMEQIMMILAKITIGVYKIDDFIFGERNKK
jgi:hypothetical protein